MSAASWHELLEWLHTEEGRYVLYAIAGALGAVVNCALEDRAVVLPRLRGYRLELGFLGTLTACLVVAESADHSFQTAFVASLCALVGLRSLKRRLERACEVELQRLRGGGEE